MPGVDDEHHRDTEAVGHHLFDGPCLPRREPRRGTQNPETEWVPHGWEDTGPSPAAFQAISSRHGQWGPSVRKYVFVINSFLAGGAERSLVELLPYLERAGVHPIVVCLKRRDVGFEAEVRAAGHDVRLLEGGGRIRKVLALRRLIGDEHPSLLHTALFEADLTGRLAAIGTGVPVVSSLVNTYGDTHVDDPNVGRLKLGAVRAIDGLTARALTDHFHAVSNAVKESAVAELGIDEDRVTVVMRGRDPERLGTSGPERRLASRTALGIAADAEVILTVGRQEYQKGHRYLIEAFSTVARARPASLLLIAGREGNATEETRGLVAGHGLEDRVRFLGHREDVADVLAAADIFAFPSLWEGLGGALIEAMALSLPIVASDIPAVREVVQADGNAILVPPGDTAALADALDSLLADEDKRAAFGIVSRRRYESGFTADISSQRMIALLESVARP